MQACITALVFAFLRSRRPASFFDLQATFPSLHYILFFLISFFSILRGFPDPCSGEAHLIWNHFVCSLDFSFPAALFSASEFD